MKILETFKSGRVKVEILDGKRRGEEETLESRILARMKIVERAAGATAAEPEPSPAPEPWEEPETPPVEQDPLAIIHGGYESEDERVHFMRAGDDVVYVPEDMTLGLQYPVTVETTMLPAETAVVDGVHTPIPASMEHSVVIHLPGGKTAAV